jgi:hypothetical protein
MVKSVQAVQAKNMPVGLGRAAGLAMAGALVKNTGTAGMAFIVPLSAVNLPPSNPDKPFALSSLRSRRIEGAAAPKPGPCHFLPRTPFDTACGLPRANGSSLFDGPAPPHSAPGRTLPPLSRSNPTIHRWFNSTGDP